ncbi:MAG: hypothetical protein AAFW64_03970, partial [Pseudomonadota bacterium]
MWRPTWIALIAVLIVVLGWQALAYRHHLRHLPAEIGVWQRLYVSERAWGFGPGGNETGILVYAMPGDVRAKIEAGGEAYLESFGPNPWGTLQGRFGDWHATPIRVEPGEWTDPDACPGGVSDLGMLTYPRGCPSILGYLGRYGYFVPVRDAVEDLANAALFSP